MKTRRKNTASILRRISQLIFFIVLPGLFIGAFSGVKAVYLAALQHHFSVTILPQLAEAAAIIPLTIFAGRFFCGWMCAFGTLGDFIYYLSQKILRRKFIIGERIDRILKAFKFVLLAFLVFAVWSFGITVFAKANPWDAFGMLFTAGKMPQFSFVLTNLLPAFIIFVGILIGSFFVERFFCRYLCPLGAIFAIVSKLRITSILKPRGKCGNCRICTKSCPMGIALYKSDKVKSGECIDCFECVAACPRKNTAPAVSGENLSPLAAGTVAALAMTGVYYAGSFAGNAAMDSASLSSPTKVSSSVNKQTASQSAQNSAPSAGASSLPPKASSSRAAGAYKDGTYEGSGMGFRGTTTVSVIVKNGKINAVNVVSYGDDDRFFSRASETVISEILAKQSAQVDAVSGATYSSGGIMDAVANALGKAK